MMDRECKTECRPDYEAEYYRLIEEVKRLNNENCELRETTLGMCKTLFLEERENNA